ncbi:MAG: polysulfide reductase NrfD [Saprospirales bacterium]|nr:polysulfide reductase NrfD [Saprospirales bacterium]
MKEELIISGRNLPHIDPHLNLWHWPIPVYLFLGGLAAGILFFSAVYYIRGRETALPTAVKWSTFLAPFLLVLGLFFLFIDLKHRWYFWRLYTAIRLESPMSWGAWTLMVITPLSLLWSASYLKELIPTWKWKWGLLDRLENLIIKYRTPLAWVMLIYALILGMYTGILLSAFNARPLWNTALLGPLFLTSGLSTGAATIMWMSRLHLERKLFTQIDLILIGIELFLIVHLFMGFLAGPEVQLEAAALFLHGSYALPFWGLVVGMGLVLPFTLEVLEMRGLKIPAALPAILILTGGLIFRIIMVEAGEATRWLY